MTLLSGLIVVVDPHGLAFYIRTGTDLIFNVV